MTPDDRALLEDLLCRAVVAVYGPWTTAKASLPEREHALALERVRAAHATLNASPARPDAPSSP